MLPLGGFQTANPLRDRFIAAFPLRPSEDPSIKGGTTALFRNESGIFYVIDDPPLLGTWSRQLIQQELQRLESLRPTELSSEEVAARWVASYLKFLCPAALEGSSK